MSRAENRWPQPAQRRMTFGRPPERVLRRDCRILAASLPVVFFIIPILTQTA
jgi:hypothetical protein